MPLLKKKFNPPPPPPLPPLLPSNKATLSNGASKTHPRETKQDPPQPLSSIAEPETTSIENSLIIESSGNSSKASSTLSVDAGHVGSKEKLANSPQETINPKDEDIHKSTETLEDSTKADDRKKDKPKPPNKPSRLKRALTSSSLTLQRLKTTKKNKRLSMTENDQTSEVREGGLWKLPGMELTTSTPATTMKEKPLKSSEASRLKFDEIANKLKKELPSLAQEEVITPLLSSLESKLNVEGSEIDIKNRELPPLPTEQHAILPPTVQNVQPSPKPMSGGVMVLDDFETYSELKPTICEVDSSKLNDSISNLHASVEAPPPLPARTYTPTSNESRKTSDVTTPPDSTLEGVLLRHSDCYPIRFRVLQGYCNDASDVNMSTNDVYDIHTVKETKVSYLRCMYILLIELYVCQQK